MPEIRMEQATKYYKWEGHTQSAVDEVSLTIAQGEFVFLVGSSGAGKSTLLSLMTGEMRPDRGKVFLGQLNLARVPPWHRPKVRLNFGRVWQEPHLMRGRTIGENLSIIARAKYGGHKEALNQMVEKALGVVGMSQVADKFPVELSGGECRRVELARALINSPPILVLDELTANLDEDNIWDIMQLLDEINRKGTTIVMATHASRYVTIMRRRVITVVDGRILGDAKKGKYGDLV